MEVMHWAWFQANNRCYPRSWLVSGIFLHRSDRQLIEWYMVSSCTYYQPLLISGVGGIEVMCMLTHCNGYTAAKVDT